ncbi:MAG: HEAT repeat domain-containing protein [Sedimentisphaerales bacterium]|nr:HEAT repeat domain-containing protein [Sedimentisphaerales bacterium]
MSMKNSKSMRLSVILAVLFAAAGLCGAQSAAEPPRTEIISTADGQWVLWLPMDTYLGVETAIDTLAKDFNVNRIWWRGGQDDMWLENIEFRPANRFYYYYWDWLRYLNREVKTNDAAIKAARKNGLEIWLWTALFEYGCQADAGGCQRFPYQGEYKIRSEHPEWVPVNKYGTRIQGGPIEFAYPEARKTIVDSMTGYVVDNGYDGIVLYTYVENFTLRYMDEFGYNQPIVDEFKKRYGVDIRTQPFDKDAWAKLRGEYVTQFLRELHAGFAKHSKKICIQLEANGDSHLPMIWVSGGKVRSVGNIYMDWERWVKEGLVNELHIYWPGNDETAKKALEICKGTEVKVSMLRNRGDMPPGVIRATMVCTGNTAETGFTYKDNIGYDDENTPPQPIEALKGDDVYAKRRVLYVISAGKQKADISDIIPSVKDKDNYVKRLALKALAKLNDPKAVPVLEEALCDPENSVRMQAAVSLGDLHGPDSIDRIFDTVKKYHLMQFDNVAACQALIKMAPGNLDAIVTRVSDPDLNVRRVAVTVLQAGLDAPGAKDALLKTAKNDMDAWMRELALSATAKYQKDPAVIQVMTDALNDPDEVVQVRAAMYLTWVVGALPPNNRLDLDGWTKFNLDSADSPLGKTQRQALELLMKLFRKYGDGCSRDDAEWGWRVVGNSILCFGNEGQKLLEDTIANKQDRRLAELAWQVVYIKQKAATEYCPVTEEQDREAHLHHPFLNLK